MAKQARSMFEATYQAELKKLKSHVEPLPKMYQELILPTLENLAWMKSKLDETRALLEPETVLIETEMGTRKNPGFEAYAQLLDRYIKAMKVLLDIVSDIQATPIRKETALDAIQNKRASQGRKSSADKKRRS